MACVRVSDELGAASIRELLLSWKANPQRAFVCLLDQRFRFVKVFVTLDQ